MPEALATEAAHSAEAAPRSAGLAAALGAARDRGTYVRRGALFLVVLGYLVAVLVLPLVALVDQVLETGAGRAIESLLTPTALHALAISFSLVAISVVVNAVVGTCGAIAIVRHDFPGRLAIDALADLPLAVSPVMIGLAFLLLVGRTGVLAPVLSSLDLQIAFAYPALVVATLFVTLPFTLREAVYLLEQLGTSEEEAATTLGASPAQVFWHVTLPNLRPALGYGLLMTVARSLGEFGAVLVLGGSIGGRTQTATTFIHDMIEERMPSSAYGMAILLSLFSVILMMALDRAKQRRKAETDAHRSTTSE